MNVISFLAQIKADSDVNTMLADCQKMEEQTLKWQKQLCVIEAPSNEEEERAVYFADLMKSIGLKTEIDNVNSVISIWPGTKNELEPVVISAHLDTVFPKGTDCTVREKDGLLYAPGIGDDTRGLAELLTLADILVRHNFHFSHPVWFVATAGEENKGNLKGSRNFFAHHPKVHAFVSIDGSKCETLHYNAVGGCRMEITYTGTGGHAMRMFGYPNCNNAMGRAISKIAELKVPDEPLTTFNIGTVRGGTVTTAIPTESTMSIDVRSLSDEILQKGKKEIEMLCIRACEEENTYWNHPTERVQVRVECPSERLGGMQPEDAEIVIMAKEIYHMFGVTPMISKGASTDANIPISMGIPSIAVGRGGFIEHGHTLNEVYHPKDAYIGVQRNFMLMAALSW